jgi:hypothetical protein
MKLEQLSLDKFKKNEIQNLDKIMGGRRAADPETGCCDAPDCCTGTDCEDSYADDSDPCKELTFIQG